MVCCHCDLPTAQLKCEKMALDRPLHLMWNRRVHFNHLASSKPGAVHRTRHPAHAARLPHGRTSPLHQSPALADGRGRREQASPTDVYCAGHAVPACPTNGPCRGFVRTILAATPRVGRSATTSLRLARHRPPHEQLRPNSTCPMQTRYQVGGQPHSNDRQKVPPRRSRLQLRAPIEDRTCGRWRSP